MEIIIILSLSLFNLAWLAFMIISPSKWDAIVEKENGFWVKKGLLKNSTAEKFIEFESGKWLKLLLMFPIAVSLLLLLFLK